mmetsp:Transcript_9334/g.20769  ORF Transcript_9334/g.20769 Transcript_9334/m.20769 type:complete len:420 (-) Transcript_9334:112-1371(-)
MRGGRRGRQRALWAALAAASPGVEGVLRYPDGAFESRFPLHVDECGSLSKVSPETRSCLLRLRRHLLEDADCNRVICDNIYTSTPIEVYANESDWVPYKNFCGHLQELFLGLFDLGMSLLDSRSSSLGARLERVEAEQALTGLVEVFATSSRALFDFEDRGAVAYANSTRSVLQRHAAALVSTSELQSEAEVLLNFAASAARRLQLLIENVSVTLLLNFHVSQLEYAGREAGRNYLAEMYGDVSSVKVTFHDIPGKRWDVLTFLLERLGISSRPLAVAEIGVEAANTSQRLLDRNPLLSYVGVDPYMGNDALYEDVLQRLAPHCASKRFTLHRSTSIAASELIDASSLDLVFLDARHDYAAVADDIAAWMPKVRPGGILSGHDFSWMFPPVAMAVYKAAFTSQHHEVHLAPDGVWWLQM